MESKLLNSFLKFSGFVFFLKKRVVQADHWTRTLPYAVLLIATELGFAIVSIPLYVFVSPKRLQEQGFVFPTKERERAHFHTYIIRRKISLTAAACGAGVFVLKVIFIGIVSFYLLGAQKLLADTQSWDFSVAGDYTYDSAKIEVTGGKAQLKGIDGQIGSAALNTLEFDPANGTEPDILHVTSSIFAIAYTGAAGDGFLETVSISATGTISAVIDTLEFDTASGLSPDIVHVSGDIFAIAYEGSGSDGFVVTVSIDATGAISNTVIDTLEFDTFQALFTDIINVSGDIFAIAYEGPGSDGFVATVTIDATGNIGAAVIDFLEFDSTNGSDPKIVSVGGGYYAVAYVGPGSDGWLATVNIDGSGNVSNAVVDTLEYDAVQGLSPSIINISGTTYAVVYEDVNNDGMLLTVDITSSGLIGAAAIDTLKFDATQSLFARITHVVNSTYAIAYEGVANDGFVSTVDIATDGTIANAVTDTLEFNTIDGITPDIVPVNATVYAIAYSDGATLDGFVSTVEITSSYDTGKPTIFPNASLTTTGATTWGSFSETAVKNGGEIYYQLSSDDGVTWKYWTGSAWATAGATNFNIADDVNTNIGSFTTSTNKIRWKAFLSSDGTQQIELDTIAIGYTENSLPVITGLSPAQHTTFGYVHVSYNIQDTNSDPNSLSTYEYSLTGAFGGEQVTMTASSTDPAHNGVSSLSSSPAGTAHTFVWDARSQLGSVFTTAYVRLRANDGIGNSPYVTSTGVTIDYVNPVVSNVSASQVLGSTNVQITYDVSDNTTDNLFTNLEISGDGGSTWTVATSTVTGAVGTGVTAGTGKTISWNAGTDYSGQQKSNMVVRVRAKDKFQNQAGFVSSAQFSLDTLSPATLTAANLQTQPNAGDTTVSIGGSFTEVNPNTNDFYIAINGGAYGSATAGTSNTSTPANQATAVGATLDGNDVISKVKIVHTDDYSQAFTNENTSPTVALKYVKPYTPQAPTLANPVTNNLNLTVNPHASETAGLEYAIFETTQSKYVQANGTLGVGAVWQALGTSAGQWGNGTGISGKVNVNGLSSPLAQYIFQVKSRNTSDTLNAASSESAFSATAQITNTAPSISFGSVGQTSDGSRYVTTPYTGTDGQGDISSIPTYQYSTNGTNWFTMTEKGSVGSNGTSSLVFLPTGSSYSFMWDVSADLPNTESDTARVRLRPNDSLIDGTTATSSVFSIDTKNPVITNITAVQNAGARTVAITYDLVDHNVSNVSLLVSQDSGSTWTVATSTASGAVGAGIAEGAGKTISWNAGTDFDNQYKTTMRARIVAVDTKGNTGTGTQSADFTVDTKAPAVSNVTAVQDSGAGTFTFNYDVSEDAGNVSALLQISSDGGSTWTVATSTASGAVGGGIVPGTGKAITWNGVTDFNDQEKTNMKIRITATDQFTNNDFTNSANFSLDTKAPRVTNVSASQNLGSNTVTITYDLADQNNSLVAVDISSDNGSTWTVATTTLSGAVGSGVTAGTGKTVMWNGATDFFGQQTSTMKVRVRATDTFNNASANVLSASFSLDTKAPVVNVTADIKAQPNAGDTSVVIGGSFTELNPDTNNFFVAISGGAYGTATAGASATSSPPDQVVAAGVTLKGNDSVSKVKVIETDTYGNIGTNENTSPSTALKFVKPYTPAAPTVGVPTVGTVDVIINKNASEVNGLEYAVFETTQSKYVQANGTLGASAVWQTLGTGAGQWGFSSGESGRITVSGLANPSYTYQFKTKSRNTSDTAHAVSSESLLSSGASSANQSPVVTLGTISQTTNGTQYVAINYTGSDLESETSSLNVIQYSPDNVAWNTMTEKAGVGSQGTSTLAFNYPGSSHVFAWDVGADLPNTEDATVYIRLRANDGTSNGNLAASSAFTIDTKSPVASVVAAAQVSASSTVTTSYTLTDFSNTTVEFNVSSDGGSLWTVSTSTASGAVGAGVVPGAGKEITWNAGVNFANQENSTMKVRVRPTDTYGNIGSFVQSANFSVDTKVPAVSNVSAVQNAGSGLVSITYDFSDANNATVFIDISEDGGSTWGVATSTLSGAVGTSVVPGTGKTVSWNANTDFPNREQSLMVRVRATDTFANASGNVSSPSFSIDTKSPIISNVSAVQNTSSGTVTISYDMSDTASTSLSVFADISGDLGFTWTVATTTLAGNIGTGQTAGTGKSITWNAGTDFANQYNANMKVRIRATDSFNNLGTNTASAAFTVDTKVPVVSSVSAVQSASSSSVSISYTLSDDTATSITTALDISSDNGGTWMVATTTLAGNIGTGQTAGAGKSITWNAGTDFANQFNANMKVRVRATDSFNNLGTNTASSAFTVDTKVPVVSSVSAVQSASSSSVSISYNLSDDTATSITTALDISSDNGGTWMVATTTLAGNIGTGQTAGAGKSITWNAGTDFANQFNANMKVRVRATDSFNNLGTNTASSAFTVDTKVPVVSSVSAVQSASSSSVSISYTLSDDTATSITTALDISSDNGGTWTVATTTLAGNIGTGQTAGAGKSITWNAGTDFANQYNANMKVRIRATDSFNNLGTNTASAAFTVDTKVPLITVVTASQGTGTSTVNILYTVSDDTSSNLTVFADISGDLGFTWTVATTTLAGNIGTGQTAGAGKTVTWNAGTDFANQYNANMKVRIRATDSFNNLGTNTASAAFTVDTKVPVVSSVSATQVVGNSVSISYTLTDDTATENNVEFGISSDGGGTWTVTTTTRSGDIGLHQQTGSRTFTWNAAVDFPGQTNTTMRARVRAIDSFGNSGAFVQSSNFSLDSSAPVITSISALQVLGGNQVNVSYTIVEATTSTVTLDISSDGGLSWNVATSTLTGAIGANILSGTNKVITWNAATDDPNEESSQMRVRLRGTDIFGNISSYVISSNFSLDTKAPASLANFTKFSSTATSATFHWTAGTDANFSRYELWYGSSATDVQNRTSTASLWGSTNDSLLTQALTVSTVITGITVQADFFVKIFAFDTYGHVTTLSEINIFTQTPAPVTQVTPPAAVVLPPQPQSIIPPRRPLLSPVLSPTNKTTVTISGLSDPRTRIDIYDNGGFLARLVSVADNDGRFSQEFIFSEGPHILTARAVDFNNVTGGFSDATPFLVDITPPSIPQIISPNNNQVISENSPVFFGVVEPLATVELTLDTGRTFQSLADIDGNWILVLPSDAAFSIGRHLISAVALDHAGNVSNPSSIAIQIIAPPFATAPVPGAPIQELLAPLLTLPTLEPGVSPLKEIPPTPSLPVVIREVTEAIELPGLPSPKIVKAATVVRGNSFEFSGTALPNQEVVVYLHSQAVLYQTRADMEGTWKVSHEQDRVELTPGDHAIYAVALNRGLKIKSRPSTVGVFTVQKNFWVMAFQYLNFQTTLVTIGVLFAAMVTLYSVRRRQKNGLA